MDISNLVQSAIGKIRDTAGGLFNSTIDKATGIPSFVGNAVAAGETVLGSAESALSQVKPIPYSIRDFLGNSAVANLNNATSIRQNTGTMGSFDQGISKGLNTALNVAGPTIKVGMTTAGGAKMLAQPLINNALAVGTGSLISGGINKLQGGSFKQGAIEGALSTPLYEGAGVVGNKLLSPLISKIRPTEISSLKPYLQMLSNPMVSEETKASIRRMLATNIPRNILASGLEAGTGNAIVGATEKADNLQQRVGNTIQAFGTGTAFGAGLKTVGYGVNVGSHLYNQSIQPSAIASQAGMVVLPKVGTSTDTPPRGQGRNNRNLHTLDQNASVLDMGLSQKGSLSQTTNIPQQSPQQLHTSQSSIESNPTGSSPILALPEGEPKQYTVKTKTQLKKILAENPNANVRIELKPEPGKLMTYGQIPDRTDVATTIPQKVESFIQNTLGYSTQDPSGGSKQANIWTKTLRKGQEKISSSVEQGLTSENSLVRNAATTIQNFFRGAGMSPDRAAASSQLRGGIASAQDRAYNVMDSLYQSLGNNKKSLERINAVLDPNVAKERVKFEDLNATEKGVYKLIREGFDLVHDISYSNGHISPETYVANKNRYVPRLYEVTELPAEVNKFVTQGKKIDNSLYRQRGDINDWKVQNSLNDPVYALGKRLAQIEVNRSIKQYTDWLSTTNLISDVERPGFTKLSDSPSYGALSGKYVLNSAAEDLKGFFFSNQAMQNLYDVFRAYDRMPVRQLQKKMLTVFNPTTNVGNIVSDNVFGFLTGVDPLTLNKNIYSLNKDSAKFKQLSDYLTRSGVLGTDITKTDFVNRMGKIDELAQGNKTNILQKASDKIQSFYGGTDDVYKVAAFKSLLDRGVSLQEATRRVADGFQNYANVGKFYDVWAKTPLVGEAFVKFQGDLMRMIKNGVVNSPLQTATFLGTLIAVSILSSKFSGESPEDRATREKRFAAPIIPLPMGMNIPLTWQTPWGEIDVARYISPFYANNDVTDLTSKMLPFVPSIDTKRDVAANIAANVSDPLLSPVAQLMVNRDFRGKPIADPKENKYQPSTMTPEEKLANQGNFALMGYTPPILNSVWNVGKVAKTGQNLYGNPQTVPQALERLAGVKVTNMTPEEIQKVRDKEVDFKLNGNSFVQKQINAVDKMLLQGYITPEQAQKRTEYLQSQIQQIPGVESTVKGSTISYLDNNGDRKTIDIGSVTSMPSSTNYDKQLKQEASFKLMDDLQRAKLSDAKLSTVLSQMNITKAQYDYYNVARQSTEAKQAWVMDKLNEIISRGGSKQEALSLLVSGRQSIGGKSIVTNSIVDNLYKQNVISYQDKTDLKKIGGDLKVQSSSGGRLRVKKTKALKLKYKKAKMIKIKIPKLKRLKIKLPKPLKIRMA